MENKMKSFLREITILVFIVGMANAQYGKIEVLDFDAGLIPHSIQYKGKIIGGAHWKDNLGESVFFVTHTGKMKSKGECPTSDGCYDAEIYAFCYAGTKDSLSLLWKTVDFERNCPFDLYAGLADSAIFITDLNSNGIAECTFLYLLSCRSDVSPSRLKLMMHEGRKKLAIRGTTRPDTTQPPDEYGGQMNIDQSFDSVESSLKDFAVRKFKEYMDRDSFQQF